MNNRTIIGPRYNLRVGDLRSEHSLRVECQACGHVGHIKADVLGQKHATYERLVQLEKRFRCQQCRGRGLVFWRVETGFV